MASITPREISRYDLTIQSVISIDRDAVRLPKLALRPRSVRETTLA